MAQHSKWGSIIAGLGILFICIATLTPGAPPLAAQTTCQGWCADSLVADFVRNIILFLPLGFGLVLAGVRPSRALLVGACLSATVELLQIRIIVGRDASMLDWISNTLGTALGATLARNLGTLLRPTPRTALTFSIVMLLAWVGVLVLGAWGIQPTPTDYPYWGQRLPELGDTPPFRGELLSGKVNGIELPSVRMTDDDVIRSSLRKGRIEVAAVVLPGPSTSPTDVAPILRVADGAQNEILMLGRGGHELVFRLRLRASTLRLETPAFALAHAFQDSRTSEAESLQVPESLTVMLDHGQMKLAARSARMERVRDFELNPAVAWSFFLPWDYWFGPNAEFLSQMWLAALLLPVGYWLARAATRRSARWILAIVTVIPTTLVLIPLAFALPSAHVTQFISAAIGVLAGWITGRYTMSVSPLQHFHTRQTTA